MCNNTCILRFHHTRRIVHKILGRLSFAKLKNPQRPTYKTIPEAVACVVISGGTGTYPTTTRNGTITMFANGINDFSVSNVAVTNVVFNQDLTGVFFHQFVDSSTVSNFTTLKALDPALVSQLKDFLPDPLFDKLNDSLSIDQETPESCHPLRWPDRHRLRWHRLNESRANHPEDHVNRNKSAFGSYEIPLRAPVTNLLKSTGIPAALISFATSIFQRPVESYSTRANQLGCRSTSCPIRCPIARTSLKRVPAW